VITFTGRITVKELSLLAKPAYMDSSDCTSLFYIKLMWLRTYIRTLMRRYLGHFDVFAPLCLICYTVSSYTSGFSGYQG